MPPDSNTLDALRELSGVAATAATEALSELLKKNVYVTTPELSVLSSSQLQAEVGKRCVMVRATFSGAISGEKLILLKLEGAREIARALLAARDKGRDSSKDQDMLNEVELDAVGEVVGLILETTASVFGKLLSEVTRVSSAVTELGSVDAEQLLESELNGEIVAASYALGIDEQPLSQLLELVQLRFARCLAQRIVTSVAPNCDRGLKLDELRSFPVMIEAIYGRTEVALRELGGLRTGVAVRLDREIDAPVSLRVNNMDFARGELVAVDGRIGVRIVGFSRPPGGIPQPD